MDNSIKNQNRPVDEREPLVAESDEGVSTSNKGLNLPQRVRTERKKKNLTLRSRYKNFSHNLNRS